MLITVLQCYYHGNIPDEPSTSRYARIAMVMDALKDRSEYLNVKQNENGENILRTHSSETFSFSSLDYYDSCQHPLISWRYRILPQLTILRPELRVNEKWNSPNNQYNLELAFRNITKSALFKRTPKDEPIIIHLDDVFVNDVYCYEYESSKYKSSHDEKTNILAIVGPRTAFDPNLSIVEWESFPKTALALVEVHSDVHWTEPCDIEVNDLLNNKKSLRYNFGMKSDQNGFFVCFFDLTVMYLKKDTPMQLLGLLATIEGAEKNDRYELLNRYILETFKKDTLAPLTSSAPKLQVSDAISGENLDSERIDTTKSVDSLDEK